MKTKAPASTQTVAVVLPAYNEATHITKVIKSLPKKMGKSAQYRVQVVVVDDCSRDDTAEKARAAGAIVIQHIQNTGAGGATRTGLRFAYKQIPALAYAVTIDADGQHLTSDVEKLVQHADSHHSQMIIGSRLHKGNLESMPLHRRLGNVGLSLYSRLLFGITEKDTQSGMRLFRAEIIPRVSDYIIDRYGFCTEMLWLARKQMVRVEEVPIQVIYTEETLHKGQSNWGVFDLFRDLLWLRVSR